MVALFIIPLGASYTTSSSFCAGCHDVKPQVESWKRSAHANINCSACHSPKSTLAFLGSSLSNLKYLFKSYGTQNDPAININSDLSQKTTTISNDLCLRCHSITRRKVTPKSVFTKNMTGSGSQKYHAKHLARKIRCVICHNRVAHDGAENFLSAKAKKNLDGKKYKNNLKMEGCVRCHPLNKKLAVLAQKYPGAPKNCETCHDKSIGIKEPQFHLDAGERWLKPKTPPGLGNGLKSERAVHGQEAIKRGKDFCFTCHDWESFCNKCHRKIFMPHKMSIWKKPKNQHVKVGLKNQKACERCHAKEDNPSVCVACHHKSFYKEMPSLSEKWATKTGGMAYVKANGAFKCWQCHDPAFCSYCHTTGKKPPMINFKKKIKGS